MTCKDCKKRNNCKDPDKSFKYDEDGDSWANWCDDFDTIHADKTIHNGGLVVTQLGYNFHIWVADEKTGFEKIKIDVVSTTNQAIRFVKSNP